MLSRFIRLARRSLPALVAALAAAALPSAGGGRPAAAAAGLPRQAFTEYRLPSGLRVVLAPDHSVPVVGVCVSYDVGARNEAPGRAGFAHLFEHLMFEGSAHVQPGQFLALIRSCGGYGNGTTSVNVTHYYEEVPREQLRLALFLEADRMLRLRLDAGTFEAARRVVEAEKRENHDSKAYDEASQKIWSLAYTKFPNAHPSIGTVDDLNGATLDDARRFYRTYYRPDNAVLAIAGDFDPAEARAAVARYFTAPPTGTAAPPIPPVDDAEPVPAARSAAARAPSRLLLTRKALPRYYCAYRIPSAGSPDYPALVALADILGDGRSARLWRALVDGNLAYSEAAYAYSRRGPGLLSLYATALTARAPLEPAAARIAAEVDRIARDGVTDAELARLRNRERVSAVEDRGSVLTRARDLADGVVCFGRADYDDRLAEALQRVTSADIQRVARAYLRPGGRVELYVRR